jgi:hypothetical protein
MEMKHGYRVQSITVRNNALESETQCLPQTQVKENQLPACAGVGADGTDI